MLSTSTTRHSYLPCQADDDDEAHVAVAKSKNTFHALYRVENGSKFEFDLREEFHLIGRGGGRQEPARGGLRGAKQRLDRGGAEGDEATP